MKARPTRPGQLSFLKAPPRSYGGELMKRRKGRQGPRPLDTRNSMHLVLRSSKAKGDWSFRKPENQRRIESILRRFAARNGIRIHASANVGNHLHLHVKLSNRHTYKAFIRAVTSAIAMAVTGASRWRKVVGAKRFWDYRPFSRIIVGRRALLTLRDYLFINELEGQGIDRSTARREAHFIYRTAPS